MQFLLTFYRDTGRLLLVIIAFLAFGAGVTMLYAANSTASGEYICALSKCGGVECWGVNGNGWACITSTDRMTALDEAVPNLWSGAGSLTTARRYHTATLLPSGAVLVAGGTSLSVIASAELYDPTTNTWSAAGALTNSRSSHTATLLRSGKVLVAGGNNGTGLGSAELADPGLAPDPNRQPTLGALNAFLLQNSQLASTGSGFWRRIQV